MCCKKKKHDTALRPSQRANAGRPSRAPGNAYDRSHYWATMSAGKRSPRPATVADNVQSICGERVLARAMGRQAPAVYTLLGCSQPVDRPFVYSGGAQPTYATNATNAQSATRLQHVMDDRTA